MTTLHARKKRLYLDDRPFLRAGFNRVHNCSDMTFRLTYEEMP